MFDSALGQRGRRQETGHDQGPVPHPQRAVFELGMDGDGQVGRQRPGGGRPYHERRRAFHARDGRLRLKLDVDGGRRVVGVFDFSFRESRLA